ncbi:ABC transporter permease [Microbacterium sp. NPDC055455]
MIRFALAQLVAHRLRLALTVIAVMLGVAFVSGSLILNDTAQKLFDDQFATAAAGADVTVRTATAFDSGMGVEVERDPLAAGVLEEVAAIQDVTAAVPVAKGAARLERDATDLGGIQLSTWVAPPIGSYPLLDGDSPSGPGEVALDKATADALGLGVGDRVTVVGEQRVDARIVGLVGFGEADGPPVGAVALATLAGAQSALGLGDGLSELLITSDLPVGDLQPLLADELGGDVQVATAQDLAAAGAEQAASNLEMLQIVLVAMSVAALVIGAFLIANTFGIVISQRTRELAVARAAGATGAQVAGSVLVEALVVGAVAAAAGVVLGIASTYGLRGLSRTFGVSIPDGDLVVQPRTVLIALAVGTVVTVASAVGPARRAATVSPLAVMRAGAAEARSVGRGRTITGAALLAVGAVVAALPTFGAPVVLLGAGLIIALVGVVMAGPAALRPLVAAVGRAGAGTVPGRLARDAALRAPRRTSATVMALAFGLALMAFVSVVGASVKAATGAQYREVISADVVIESAGQEMLGGVHASVYDEVLGVAEVGTATRLKYGHWKDGESTSALTAFDPERIADVAGIRMVDGSLGALTGGGVIIAERVAADRELGVGDELPMTFARTGERSLPVVGVIADSPAQALQTDYFVSLDTYAGLFTEDMDASIFVTAADGTTPAELTAALGAALDDHPTVQVRDQAAVIAGRTQTVDQIFGLVTVLLGFAMVIAVLGIANTLALSIVERTREIGLLRSVGMSRGGVALMVQTEAVMVAVVALVTGLALGIGAAFAAVGALSTIAPLGIVIPVDQLVALVVVVAVAGLVAGLAPARGAARLPVLEAIAHV